MTSKFNNTHQEIINSAVEMLRQVKPEDLTVEQVCVKVGISRSTFYNHFRNMEDLINEHFSQVCQLNSNKIGWVLAGKTAYDKMMRIHEAYIQESYLPNSVMLYKINMKSYLKNATVDRMNMNNNIRNLLLPLIVQAQNNREIENNAPAEDLCEAAIKIHWGNMYLWAITDGSFDRSAMMRHDLDTLYCVREDLRNPYNKIKGIDKKVSEK